MPIFFQQRKSILILKLSLYLWLARMGLVAMLHGIRFTRTLTTSGATLRLDVLNPMSGFGSIPLYSQSESTYLLLLTMDTGAVLATVDSSSCFPWGVLERGLCAPEYVVCLENTKSLSFTARFSLEEGIYEMSGRYVTGIKWFWCSMKAKKAV